MNPLQSLFERTFGRVWPTPAPAGRPVPTYVSVGGPPVDWQLLEVLLDGEPVRNVVAVDTSRGVAIREVLDDQGQLVLRGDIIARELHRGNYSLRWRTD